MLAHPDLAHAGAPNYSSSIRHMLYFRVKVKTHARDFVNIPAAADVDNQTEEDTLKVATASPTLPFHNWDEVVGRHEQDLWADLPVVRHSLGKREVEHTMRLFVPDYACI